MIGDKIIDYIDSNIVMEELMGRYARHNKNKRFDFIVGNHCVTEAFIFFRDIIIDYVFYQDNSGGSVTLKNLSVYAIEIIEKFVDSIGVRTFSTRTSYSLYIENEEDEEKVLHFLYKVYGVDEREIS